MRQIGTIIKELEKTHNEVENYELIYNLLSEDRIDDAKDNLSTLIRITVPKKESNNVIYKILKMVNQIYFADRNLDEVMKYHNSYIELLNISKGGTEWVFGDNYDLIVESNVVITDIIKNIIPIKYDQLIPPSSVYDNTIMSIIHKDIDEVLVRWVSEIMRGIEILDTYLIQHEFFSIDTPISDLLFRIK